jgi:hypothetical protein
VLEIPFFSHNALLYKDLNTEETPRCDQRFAMWDLPAVPGERVVVVMARLAVAVQEVDTAKLEETLAVGADVDTALQNISTIELQTNAAFLRRKRNEACFFLSSAIESLFPRNQ